jgi:hypothetical protein
VQIALSESHLSEKPKSLHKDVAVAGVATQGHALLSNEPRIAQFGRYHVESG